MKPLNESKILITGGTGSFGQAFVKHTKAKRIIIYSRGEHKQQVMQEKYPHCDYFLGDIRDPERLQLAMRGVDIVIHAAALKIVPKGESDPQEFVKTNIIGGMNVVSAAIHNDVSKVVHVSTDKACDPVNLYGATKLCTDYIFRAANVYNLAGKPVFISSRYGNCLGSTGSVVPVFMDQALRGEVLTITDPGMTRFVLTLKQAVEWIHHVIEKGKPGDILVPDLKAITVMDIAQAAWDKTWKTEQHPYTLLNELHGNLKTKIIGIRPGEKRHEKLEGTNGCYYSDKAKRFTKEEFIKLLEEI